MTGRQLINSALRAINAIGNTDVPTHDMFENSREMLNMLFGSMSAEELMPSDFSQVITGLYSAVPNYTINAGDGFDSDSICVNQKPADGGSQTLTLDGTYVTSGVATPDVPRHIIIASTADDSGRTFIVAGTSGYSDTITETITGPNATTVRGVKQFKTVTSVTIDGDATGRLSVGTDFIINMRLPTKTVYAYIRDPNGLDTPLMIVDRNRYDEIPDKDEVGTPTRLFYDRSSPSGEIFLHPVPAGGLSLDVDVGSTEYIANGDFASGDTGWTLESQWAVAGGKLVRTPGTGDPILGPELISDTARNSTFDAGNSRGDWVTNQTSYLQASATNGFENSGCLQFKPTLTDPINLVLDEQYLTGGTLLPSTEYQIAMGFVKIVDVTEEFPMNLSCSILDNIHDDVVSPVTTWTSAETSEFSAILTSGSGSITDGEISFQRTGGGNATYPLAFVDNFSIKVVTGYSPVGADTASQVTGDLATEFVEGETYRLTFTVSSFAAGTCTPSIGGTNGDAVTEDGDHSMDIVAGSGTSFILSASSAFDASFDDISIVKVTDGTATTGTAYDLHLDLWLPFVEITAANVDNAINLPGEYLLAFRWSLAADLAPEYGKEVSRYVFIRAKETKDVIRMLNGIVPKDFSNDTPLETVRGQPAANSN